MGILLRFVFPLALAFLLLGHTLAAPLSLIDDGLFYERSVNIRAAISDGEFGSAWKLVWTPDDNRFGPGMLVQALILYGFFDASPLPLHLVKVLSFAVLLMGMAEILRLERRGAFAIICSLFIFALFGSSTLYPDFQTHLGNWQRLHTTDSYFVWMIVWLAAALLHVIRPETPRKSRIAWMVVACLLTCFSTLTKISAVAPVAGGIIALLLLGFTRRAPGVAASTVLIPASILPLMAIPGLFFFRPWQTREIILYGDALSFAPETVLDSITYAAAVGLDAWGPLAFLAIGMAVWRFFRGLVGRPSETSFSFTALVLGMGAAAACAQCLWKISLPRYMVTYTPFVAILSGVCMDDIQKAVCHHLRSRFTRPRTTLVAASVVGFAVITASMIPVLLWQRPTVFKWAPVLCVFTAALLGAGLAWWHRLQPRRVAVFILVPAGLFTGLLIVHAVCLGLYAHQTATNYLVSEHATTELLEVARQMEGNVRESGPVELFTNMDGEPPLQAQAFMRAFNMTDSIRLRPYVQWPEISSRDRFLVFSHENHWGTRVVPSVVAGWRNKPLAERREQESIVMLHAENTLQRSITVEPGTVVTGFEFRGDASTVPSRSQIEVTLADQSGTRAVLVHEGALTSHMNTNIRFLALDSPFSVAGESVDVTIRIAPGHSAETILAQYLRTRGRIAFPAYEERGEMVMAARLFGTQDTAPLYTRESQRLFKASSFVAVSPGAIAGQILSGKTGPRSSLSHRFRPIQFQYRVETYRTAIETGSTP